jgi:hypothetical protein
MAESTGEVEGTTAVKLADGTMCHAEVHWYEAHGISARELKIKRVLEIQSSELSHDSSSV